MTVVPVVSPASYAANRRKLVSGVDPNRQFKEDVESVPESLRPAWRLLRDEEFDLVLDLPFSL